MALALLLLYLSILLGRLRFVLATSLTNRNGLLRRNVFWNY